MKGVNKNSDTGTRTQVARVKAEYPNQLDYIGDAYSSAATFIPGILRIKSRETKQKKINKGRWRIRTADLSDPNGESYH